jgi:phage-related protein
MPRTTVLFFRERPGDVPVLDWLRGLRHGDRRGYAKCVARIQRLGALGHQLRRPAADSIRDGICELRARRGRVQYRVLYFFYGQHICVLAHGLAKEDKVPVAEVERALRRKATYEKDPGGHTFEMELGDDG